MKLESTDKNNELELTGNNRQNQQDLKNISTVSVE